MKRYNTALLMGLLSLSCLVDAFPDTAPTGSNWTILALVGAIGWGASAIIDALLTRWGS